MPRAISNLVPTPPTCSIPVLYFYIGIWSHQDIPRVRTPYWTRGLNINPPHWQAVILGGDVGSIHPESLKCKIGEPGTYRHSHIRYVSLLALTLNSCQLLRTRVRPIEMAVHGSLEDHTPCSSWRQFSLCCPSLHSHKPPCDYQEHCLNLHPQFLAQILWVIIILKCSFHSQSKNEHWIVTDSYRLAHAKPLTANQSPPASSRIALLTKLVSLTWHKRTSSSPWSSIAAEYARYDKCSLLQVRLKLWWYQCYGCSCLLPVQRNKRNDRINAHNRY